MRRPSLPFAPSPALLSLALALPLAACTASSGGGGTSNGGGGASSGAACDPLAPAPITLGNVVGVGEDAKGTLYVDAANGVFVSGGGKLIRQHVVGTGQEGENEYNFAFAAPGADESTARTLLVETTGATADEMGLGANGKGFLDQGTSGVTLLTLVDPGKVSGMPVVNTPNVIDYLADVSNGDVLLATLPMNDDSTSGTGGISIFYGPPSAVAQRTVSAFDESLSGDGTVTFLVDDDEPYVLAFGGPTYVPDAGVSGQFTLLGITRPSGAALGVTLRSPTPTTLPAGLSFTCQH